jgi:hypothetical protein
MQTEIQIHQNWRKKCGRSMKGKHIDQIMGKALERRRGEKEIDRQSDLYVCIYQRRRMEWRKQRGKKGRIGKSGKEMSADTGSATGTKRASIEEAQ